MDGAGVSSGLRKAAVLPALLLCASLVGPAHPGTTPVPHTDALPDALSRAVDSSALGPGSPVPYDDAPVGPYAATEAALVDVNCRLRGGTGAGTGIVLGSDGVAVTNNHVVAEAISITATDLGNGRRYPVVVVARDPARDVAVIRLVGAAGLAVAPLGDSDQLEVGDPVTALGNAGGRGGAPTVTTGEVTALDQSIVSDDDYTHRSRRLREMIEVSAAVPAGDSGGALLGGSGVIGMNTAEGPHAGFAVPINTVLAIARSSDTEAVPTAIRRAGPPPSPGPAAAADERATRLLRGAPPG